MRTAPLLYSFSNPEILPLSWAQLAWLRVDLEGDKMSQCPVFSYKSCQRDGIGQKWSQSDSESSKRQKKLLEGMELATVHKSWAGLSNTFLTASVCSSGAVWGAVAGKESPMWGQPGGGESWKQKGEIRAETDTGKGKHSSQCKHKRLLVTTKSN